MALRREEERGKGLMKGRMGREREEVRGGKKKERNPPCLAPSDKILVPPLWDLAEWGGGRRNADKTYEARRF